MTAEELVGVATSPRYSSVEAAALLEAQGVAASELTSALAAAPRSCLEGSANSVLLQAGSESTEMVVHSPPRGDATQSGLIVLLHGAGGSGVKIGDLGALLCELSGMFVACPTATMPSASSSNFELGGLFGIRAQHHRWDYGPHGVPLAAHRWALKHLPIDPDHCVLVGHSMGAIATWNIAARTAHSWAGAIPVNGALSMWEQFGPDHRAAAILGNLTDVPLLALHGTADTRVPAALERDTIEALRSLGNRHASQVLVEGGEHQLSTMRLTRNQRLVRRVAKWAATCRRSAYPTAVRHCTFDALQGRKHWVEVIEMERAGICAEVCAQSTRDAEIVIDTCGVRRLSVHLHTRLIKPGDVRIVVNGQVARHRFSVQLESVIASYRAFGDIGLLAEQTINFDVAGGRANAEEGNMNWTTNTTY